MLNCSGHHGGTSHQRNHFHWITSWVVFHQPILKNMCKSNWIMISPGFNLKIPKIFETTTQINAEKIFIVIPNNSFLGHEPVDSPKHQTAGTPKSSNFERWMSFSKDVTCFSFQPGIFRKKNTTCFNYGTWWWNQTSNSAWKLTLQPQSSPSGLMSPPNKTGTTNTFLYSWWFFTNPSEKYAHVKLDHLPQISGWKFQKIFETATTNLQSSQSFAWTSEDQRYGRYHLASPSHKMAAVRGTFRRRFPKFRRLKKKRPKKIFEKPTTWIKNLVYVYIQYVPGTQMTFVLMEKGLVLGGWPSKIEVSWVVGTYTYGLYWSLSHFEI